MVRSTDWRSGADVAAGNVPRRECAMGAGRNMGNVS
jgi:hypothetical protein